MRRRWSLVLFATLFLAATSAVWANSFCAQDSSYFDLGDEGTSYPQCSTLKVCQQPELAIEGWELANPDCDPMNGLCAVKVKVATKFPGNHQNNPAQSGFAYSFANVALKNASGGVVDTCGYGGAVILKDLGRGSVPSLVEKG